MSGSGNHTKKRNVPKGLQGLGSNVGGGTGLESVNEMSEQLESIQQVSGLVPARWPCRRRGQWNSTHKYQL